MIILKLYIYSLKTKKQLKLYRFNSFGINIILGEKSEESSELVKSKEANGSGKTTMVECLRYLLGSSLPSAFNNRPLLAEKDIFVVLELDIDKKIVFLGRMMNDPSMCFYRKADVINWDFSAWEQLENEEQYKTFLTEFIFGAQTISEPPPSLGQLREYIIRDEKQGFGGITLPERGAIENFRVLAYLCGFPSSSEKEIVVYKRLQRKQNELIKQIKMIGDDVGELKIKEKKLNHDIDKIGNIISNLDMADKLEDSINSYNEIKVKIVKIQGKIFEHENIIIQYKKNIDNLDEKIKEIRQVNNIEPFYQQLLGYFPQNVTKNYEEVKSFYDFMVENRGKYFKSKIDKLSAELKLLLSERNGLQKILEQNTKLINSKDLLADLTNVTEEIREKNIELAEIRYKIDFYNKKKDINDEINRIKQEIILLTAKKYDEYKNYDDIIIRIQQMFDSLMLQAYKESGILEFEFDNRTGLNDTTGRIKIKCHIEDENSHGRLYMKINIFDLSWFLSGGVEGVGFLLHDGSYSKPDKDVKCNLLKYVHSLLKAKQEGQYIITANVDEFSSEAIKSFRENKHIIAELDRNNEHQNRFFGFKF